MSAHPKPIVTVNNIDVLEQLDRARYDIEHGWHAAAYDAASRAVRRLEQHTNPHHNARYRNDP